LTAANVVTAILPLSIVYPYCTSLLSRYLQSSFAGPAMATFGITTTQNVEIQQESASVLHRSGAWFLDVLILLCTIWALYLVLDLLPGSRDGLFTVFQYINYAVVFIFLTYPLITESMLDGQTLGKKIIGIRVAMLDGSRPTFGAYMIRWLIGLFELTFAMGTVAFLTVLFSRKSQRLGDMISGTTVVRVKPSVTLNSLLLDVPEEATRAPYPEAINLTDVEVQVLRDVLAAQKNGMAPARATDLLYKAVGNLEVRLSITCNTLPELFVQDMIRSYAILHGR
jgi:uncharacterized RDD family membrane protein YckC